MIALLMGLAGCQSGDNPFSDSEPKTITESGTRARTTGNNQTLIASSDQNGCYSVSQSFYTPSEGAKIQLNTRENASASQTLHGTNRGMIGWGIQLQDGNLAFPLQGTGNADHGILVTTPNGSERHFHDLSDAGLTGVGAVRENQDGSLYAVTNNADYSSGFSLGDKGSSLVTVSPYQNGHEEFFLGTNNATGIIPLGNEILVSSAGDYSNPEDGSVYTYNAQDNAFQAEIHVPTGMGLNGNIPFENGSALLTGFATNDSGQSVHHMGLTNGTQYTQIDFPGNCSAGMIAGAQFVQNDGDYAQIVFNSQDSSNGKMNRTTLVI